MDQGSDADSRAAESRGDPRGGALQQFGPVREEAALSGLDGVDAAAVFHQKMALLLLGFAKTEEVAGAVDVAAFELSGGEVEVAGGAAEIVFREVDIALHVAAPGAPALTREPHALHADRIT